jgi:hypothetical protein
LELEGLDFEEDESALDFEDEDEIEDDPYLGAFLAHLDNWDHGGRNATATIPYLRALDSEVLDSEAQVSSQQCTPTPAWICFRGRASHEFELGDHCAV